MSSVELRQINRRLEELQVTVNSIPTNPASASSFASAQSVVELDVKVLDLENKYNACKKFLEDALEKIGLLEKKLLEVESKACMCAKSDASVSSEEDVKENTVTLSENPVFDVSDVTKPLEEIVELSADEDEVVPE